MERRCFSAEVISMAEYPKNLQQALRVGADFTLIRGRGFASMVSLSSSTACLALVVSLTVLYSCAWSQSERANVSGTITDKSGAVILRARVVIVNQHTGFERNTFTDTAGSYHFSGLPSGPYTVRVEDQGFQTQVREGVAIVSGSESVIDFSLTVGDVRQQVIVNANTSGLDITSSTVSGLVQESSLTKLPLNNQDLFNIGLPNIKRTWQARASKPTKFCVRQSSIAAARTFGDSTPHWRRKEFSLNWGIALRACRCPTGPTLRSKRSWCRPG